MGRPVVHWEINAKDSPGLQEFYRDLFAWKIDTSDPDYSFVDTGSDAGIDGGIAQAEQGDPVGLTFYVQVDDLRAALNKVEALGGRVIVPPTEMPDMVLLAVFEDPEGNQIGLVEG